MTLYLLDKMICCYNRHFAKSFFSKEEGLMIAKKYKLVAEYEQALKFGFNPDEALQDWDIYPYGTENKVKKDLNGKEQKV